MIKSINYKGVNVDVSEDGTICIEGKQRQIYYNHDGYPCVSLLIPNTGWRSIGVHRLVAIAFIPNPNNLPEVNHIDYNRANYNISNLEWVTHCDNVRYSVKNRTNIKGENNPNYGNKKLSEKYALNKELSKEKNSRPGGKNGRAVPVDVYFNGMLYKSFSHKGACLKWANANLFQKYKNAESARKELNKLIKTNQTYLGFSFVPKIRSNDYRKDNCKSRTDLQ